MIRRIAIIVAILAAGAARTAVAQDVDPQAVRTAIDRAIVYLESHQRLNGSWDDYANQPGGVTSLVTLALLNAGVSVEDPHVQKALGYLRNLRLDRTYAVSLQTMALCAGEPKKDLLIIRRNAQWLEETQKRGGQQNSGSWSYPQGGGDNSNAQFALLALHEAQRVGVDIKRKTWEDALLYWEGSQNLDGSWGYTPGAPGSGSMTCAGIASVVICSSELSVGDATIKNGRVQCCGHQVHSDSVERGIDWLARNWSVSRNPGPGAHQIWTLYYLYGLERVGRMTSRRFIGTHDWYRLGANYLVKEQDPFAHFWKGLDRVENNYTIGTSLGLLFLAKGRRPILISKLKHDPEDDWNHHRSDLANLTTYTESRWKRDLTWQVIDVRLATVDDLLQTPVLFINGRQAAQFTPEQIQTLRDYVDRGGFLFIESCCDGDDFDEAIRATLAAMFPEPEHSLRKLSPSHPIWSMEERVNPKYLRDLLGIDVGCRTSVIYCPQDLSCYWELGRAGRMSNLPQVVRDEVQACLSIGLNVVAYATGRDVKFKDEIPENVVADPRVDSAARGKLYVANLRHPGGCNSAPGALLNLLRTAGEKLKLHVSTDAREVGMTDPQLFEYHMVFMHGRSSFRLTPEEREKLKLYVQRGGVILADAICSSAEFDASFRQEMKNLFPEKPLERIPASHPMFTKAYGGDDLPTVERRQPEIGAGGGPLKAANRQTEPYLEGIKIGDRYAIVYSRYDLSCALESHDSLECEGYTRKDAARIGLNVLLYSLHQ